jgi:hypothetical protein
MIGILLYSADVSATVSKFEPAAVTASAENDSLQTYPIFAPENVAKYADCPAQVPLVI